MSFKGRPRAEGIERKEKYFEEQRRLADIEKEREAQRQREAEEAARLEHPSEAETLLKMRLCRGMSCIRLLPSRSPRPTGCISTCTTRIISLALGR